MDDNSSACGGSGGSSGPDWKNLKGYSAWEIDALQKLFNNGGPNAIHGVNYIIANGIHITAGTGWQSGGSSRRAWFDEGNNTLTLAHGLLNSDGTPDNDGLALIIHEARHLEQGPELSHSKLGEMDAWQIQFDVLEHLGVKLSSVDASIKDAPTLEIYMSLVKDNYTSYWNVFNKTPLNGYITGGLYTYPDTPDYCWSVGACSFMKPWWLRLNFP